jgi:hypothetical protein
VALFGVWTEDELRVIRLQAQALPGVLSHLRWVSHAQAEAGALALAGRLRDALGPEFLARARYTAIPRGGHVVLAELAYALGLERAQLSPGAADAGAPLVVVDDCAITGARFRQFLAGPAAEADEVISAHLCSHPELRAAITREEPRVRLCVAGEDLTDHGPEDLGADYPAWQERWLARSGPRRYWVGRTEHVCFPWSEPGRTVWDEVAGECHAGWRLVPAEHCLARRGEPRCVPVQLQPGGPGPLGAAPEVLWCSLPDRTLVAAPAGVVALEGVAAEMWGALIQAGTTAGALSLLTGRYPAGMASLEADLESFASQLRARGLLVECRP